MLGSFGSSRFTGTRMGSLHARSVPPVENNDRGIAISIVSMPASGADKGRLVLAALAVHGPTGRAGLRRVGRIHLHEPRRLVGKHRLDLVPTYIQDGAVKSALLCDADKGGASGHVLGAQPLDNDRAILASDGRRGLMRPVFAGTGLPCLDGGRAADRFKPALRSSLAPRHYPLCRAVPALQHRELSGQSIGGPVRKHQRDSDATIDPDRAARVSDIGIDFAPYADLPPERCARDNGLADMANDRPRHAELDPSDLGEFYPPPSPADFLDSKIPTMEAEGVIYAFPLRSGVSGLPLPCAPEGFVQVLQGTLLCRLTDIADKVELSPQERQFPRLRNIVEIVARRCLVAPPVVAALLKGKVPYQTAHARKLSEKRGLFRRRAQWKSETAKNHIKLFAKDTCPCQ